MITKHGELSIGSKIKIYWAGKLVDAEIISFKHGVPNIKILKSIDNNKH
jgi:hypothetical protein